MNWINNVKIGTRLNIALGTTVFIIFFSIGVYIFDKLEIKTLADTDIRIQEQVTDLSELIEQEIAHNQGQVRIGMAYAEEYLSNLGYIYIDRTRKINVKATNQKTKKTTNVTVDRWEIKGKQLQYDKTIVDKIQKEVGVTATIFQRINNGFLRISTNVLNKNGERAVNTFIPNASEVSQAIISGEEYTGRAFVVDDWYLSVYRPIVINGKIEGMFYVGIPEKNLSNLKEIFNSKKYFDTGYPFIIDTDGLLVLHPTSEGINAGGTEYFKSVLNSKEKFGKVDYIWDNQDKILYYKYISSIESYVCATILTSELTESIYKIRRIIFYAIFLGIFFLLVILTLISRSMTIKINRAVHFAEKIAQGDLSTNLDIDQKDELGHLGKALNTMVIHLKDIVSNIKNGANNIAAASQEMSSNSQQVSQGASEQASSAEEISSSMQQMSSNIMHNTDNAQQTEKISAKAASDIIEGSSEVNTTVDSMKDIAGKISIIGDIASQTNILALNAAVEAARAGEHGRGFAVVAAEVRKLAERSQKAAAEIDEVSKSSVIVAENSGQLLNNIVPDIQKTSKLVEEITAASIEQNSGAEQINNAINQLNQVTQQNAAAAEEMATSSEELSSQAEQLRDLISYFKLNEGDFNAKKVASTPNDAPVKEIKEMPQAKTNIQKAQKGFKLDMGGRDKTDSEFEEF
jgi:methyl-accepting chemotaxis protein